MNKGRDMGKLLKVVALMFVLSGTAEATNETYYAIHHSVDDHDFILAIFPPITNMNKVMCGMLVYSDTFELERLGRPARLSCKSRSTTDPRLIKEVEKAILE